MDLLQFEILSLFNWIDINFHPLILLSIFIMWSFSKQNRNEWIEYLESLNMLTFAMGIFFATFSIITLWDMSFVEGESGSSFRIGVLSTSWWIYFVIRLILFLGLLKKKLRRSFAYSLLLGVVISFEVLLILLTNLHADFLPSSFSISIGQLQSFLIYGLTAFAVYLIRRKWSRSL